MVVFYAKEMKPQLHLFIIEQAKPTFAVKVAAEQNLWGKPSAVEVTQWMFFTLPCIGGHINFVVHLRVPISSFHLRLPICIVICSVCTSENNNVTLLQLYALQASGVHKS